MLDTFTFNVDLLEKNERLFLLLKGMWNTEYADLYDEEYFNHSEVPSADLDEGLEQLLDTFIKESNDEYVGMLNIVGRTLCAASFPHLRATLNEIHLKWFRDCLGRLDNGKKMDVSEIPINR